MGRLDRKQQESAAKVTKKSKKRSVSVMSGEARAASSNGKTGKLQRFKNWFRGLNTWKKVLLIAGTVIIVLLLTAGIVAYSFFSDIFDDIHKTTPEDYDLSLVDVDGYYNILLLGVDSRDMKNLEGTRSDAIMIVSINKDTNDVKILSVYRDTFLKMGDTSTYDKITHACVYGGPEMTMKSLNQALDLNISNYVVVNFKAVADLVDAVGGIEVNVEDYEIQQLNKYTIETAENIGREDYSLVQSAGTQTLEGVQAVSYGRIRKGVGDDFKRTERMRTVITLVMDKMKEMSFGDIKDIIKMMTPQVQTNLSKSNILALGIRLPQYNITGTDGWPYNVSTGYINSVSYVFPSDLASNVMELHEKFFGQTDYVISSTASAISAAITQKIEAERTAGNIENEEQVTVDTSQNNMKEPESGSGSTSDKNSGSSGSGSGTSGGSGSSSGSGTSGGSGSGSGSGSSGGSGSGSGSGTDSGSGSGSGTDSGSGRGSGSGTDSGSGSGSGSGTDSGSGSGTDGGSGSGSGSGTDGGSGSTGGGSANTAPAAA